MHCNYVATPEAFAQHRSCSSCIYPMHCNYVATPSIKRFGIEEDQGRFSRTSQICALRCVTLDTMPSLSPSKSFPYAFREPPGILPEPQVRGKSVQIIG
jgi:hypothetical protein